MRISSQLKHLKIPRIIYASEIKKLLSVIDEQLYTGFRDKVIIFVLLDTLVRISELVAIKRSNVDLKGGFITARSRRYQN